MTEKNIILEKETANDGQTVFLFYEERYGMYTAFGWSAYYTTMVVDPMLSYSDELQMPVALIPRDLIRSLRQSLTKVEHEAKKYYVFRLRQKIGGAGYQKWVKDNFSILYIK